jgi:hypothetical protein
MRKSNKTVLYRGLQATVVVGAILLVLVKWMAGGDGYNMETPEEREVERNERSTPRAFILPATPSIAFEQERQKSERTKQVQIVQCLGVLRRHGFPVDYHTTLLNSDLVEAIYVFQIAHHLPASGRLDEETMRELKCH